MSWQGNMQCIVMNNTGGPITNVSVAHTWNATQSVSVGELAQGDVILTPFSIETGSGGSDLWTISCVDASGENWVRSGKQCDIEEEDFDSGEAVRVTFGPFTDGWSVIMPVSSSCTDNYYADNGPARLDDSLPYSAMAEIIVATALGFVPESGNLLSGLVYLFWQPALSGVSPWTQICQQTAQMIDQKIEQNIYQNVADTLTGLQNDITDYVQAAATTPPDNSVTAGYWITTDALFDNELPSFQQGGYEVNLLPLFAQAANLHLVLLRDGVLFGPSWGWDESWMQKVQTKLTDKTKSYTDYANKYCQQGYEQITKSTTRDDHACEPFASVNRYVRLMTLGVTDFLQVWPYLDPTKYPDPVTPYLDREIYSDPQGSCDNSGPIELASPPTLPIVQIAVWGGDRIDAAQLTYPGGGGPGGVTQTPRMGAAGGGSPQPPRGGVFDLTNSSQVVVAEGLSGDVVNALSFTFADGTATDQLGGGYPGGGSFSFSYPGEYMSRLHINGVSDYYGTADCVVFGFKYHSFGQLMSITWDGTAWSADNPVGGIATSAAPALGTFNGSLYCLYQGDLDASLRYTVFDGTSWSAEQQVPGAGLTASPAVTEFDGRLYVAHQGAGPDYALWCSVFDGTSWQADTNVPQVGLTAGPSLAVYDGSLYCFHQGAGLGDLGQLWYIRNDGSAWQHPDTRISGVRMTGRPSAVVYEDQLYCFYQGAGSGQSGGDGHLWYVRFDGGAWSSPQQVSDVGITGSPEAVVYDGAICVLHKGWENMPGAPLWYSVFDGNTWQPDAQLPNASGASGPAAAVLGDVLYCLYQSPGQAPSLDAARVRYISAPNPVELDRLAGLPGFRLQPAQLSDLATRENWAGLRADYWSTVNARRRPRPTEG